MQPIKQIVKVSSWLILLMLSNVLAVVAGSFIGNAVAQAAGANAAAAETVPVTLGVAGAFLLGSITVGGAIIACTVWIVTSINAVKNSTATLATQSTERHNASERRHDETGRRLDRHDDQIHDLEVVPHKHQRSTDG